MEVWKDVVGYEGLYQVSNYGNVKRIRFVNNKCSKPKELVIKKHIAWNGRIQVDLSKEGKHKRTTVHRLVANAFIPNPNNLPQINHIDGNPQNNMVENLEWCDGAYNMKHAYQNNLMPNTKAYNEKNKKPIVRSDGKLYECAYSAAKDMGVSVFSIRDVLKGRTHACKGYSFVYQRDWGQANG